MHDEAGGIEHGEVYRYDGMGRLIEFWNDIESPHDFATTDPTSATASYEDFVEHTIGSVFERTKVEVTPDGGSTTTTNYVVNDGYQITSVGGTSLTWDDNGQLTDDGSWDYRWTALGQLYDAQKSGSSTRTFTYDALGRRVHTQVGSSESEYLYHGSHMIGETDGTDWLWMEVPMAQGEGMLEHIALDTNDIDGDSDTTEYRQYAVHEDFQNTVWALSDAATSVVERYVQDDPYGLSHTLDSSNADIGAFASEIFHIKRMHGGVIDEELELYDFRNRWLSPQRGQWMSRDQLGQVDSWNLMQFAFGRPLQVSDVNGLKGDGWVYPCPQEGSCEAEVESANEQCDGIQKQDPCWEACQEMSGSTYRCQVASWRASKAYIEAFWRSMEDSGGNTLIAGGDAAANVSNSVLSSGLSIRENWETKADKMCDAADAVADCFDENPDLPRVLPGHHPGIIRLFLPRRRPDITDGGGSKLMPKSRDPDHRIPGIGPWYWAIPGSSQTSSSE